MKFRIIEHANIEVGCIKEGFHANTTHYTLGVGKCCNNADISNWNIVSDKTQDDGVKKFNSIQEVEKFMSEYPKDVVKLDGSK